MLQVGMLWCVGSVIILLVLNHILESRKYKGVFSREKYVPYRWTESKFKKTGETEGAFLVEGPACYMLLPFEHVSLVAPSGSGAINKIKSEYVRGLPLREIILNAQNGKYGKIFIRSSPMDLLDAALSSRNKSTKFETVKSNVVYMNRGKDETAKT